jgi:hypothetical protein
MTKYRTVDVHVHAKLALEAVRVLIRILEGAAPDLLGSPEDKLWLIDDLNEMVDQIESLETDTEP